MCRRSGQSELKSCVHLAEISHLWLGWSQIAESTDTWLWQSAACLVCLSLQMFAADLSGCTPLNLFDIYIRLYAKTVSVKQVCLGAMTICQRLEFCWRYHYDLQESITSDGVGVWVLLRTNWLAMFKAWEPKAKLLRSSWNWNLESLIYPTLAFHCAKSAEQHWLLVGATSRDGKPPYWAKGDPSLVALTLHSHIILQSITGNLSSNTM